MSHLSRFSYWPALILSTLIGVYGFSIEGKAAITAPPLSGPVIDEASLLNAHTKNLLTQSLFQLQKETGIQLQVYIIKSLQGDAIESVAIQLFDQWKLGDEKTDKGLLFLIAPNEKRLRIEVGQGLEGDIPDVIAKRIIADEVKPYFQQGDFNSGILQGVISIQRYLGVNTDSGLNSELKQTHLQSENHKKKPLNGIVILMVIGIWLALFMFNPSLALYLLFSLLRGGGGGSGGGGSWSGRGGRSSGGGASGGW